MADESERAGESHAITFSDREKATQLMHRPMKLCIQIASQVLSYELTVTTM